MNDIKEKIIVENRTDYPTSNILDLVSSIVENGKVSNYGKQYCYVTQFKYGVTISCEQNKGSFRFVAYIEAVA